MNYDNNDALIEIDFRSRCLFVTSVFDRCGPGPTVLILSNFVKEERDICSWSKYLRTIYCIFIEYIRVKIRDEIRVKIKDTNFIEIGQLRANININY